MTTALLIELPDGNWIDPQSITGIRLIDDQSYGPRIVIDANNQPAVYFLRFADAEAARGWLRVFGEQCNEYRRQ